MGYPKVTCPRCKGTKYMLGQEGKVPNYRHNERGLCFACDGEGTLLKRSDGKLVRRDLSNGNWLWFNEKTGSFIGVVDPIFDDIGLEYEIIWDKHKACEDEECWTIGEPVFDNNSKL